MTIDVTVPALGESVTEATVAKWFKAVGEPVAVDEPLCELETDKVALEVFASTAGTLAAINAEEGTTVEIGALLGQVAEGGGVVAAPAAPAAAPTPVPSAPPPRVPAPPAATQTDPAPVEAELSPAVRKLVAEYGRDSRSILASGPGGRITKGDVLKVIESGTPTLSGPLSPAPTDREERVRMTRLRRRIAERLKEAQNTAAMLTTFNEVDMTRVLAAREAYREGFEKKHGVRLGFMSFFIKACIVGLKEMPAVNAEIQGDEIVYKNHYDIGIAVSSPNGLVVPVVRDADALSFAAVEGAIGSLGRAARDGKLTMEDMTGGTFTITNGGVFGSLLSTPILNPPQSAILGMHKIQERPVVVDGEIVARPMMYLALSYDHRIIDGREAVSFLVRVKDGIEDPQRILLDL